MIRLQTKRVNPRPRVCKIQQSGSTGLAHDPDVVCGTIAKQVHFLDLPDWYLGWVSPFVLMVFGYKARRKITERVESRRERGKNTREE